MLEVVTGWANNRSVVTLYHEWDIPDKSRITTWDDITLDDIGKFIQFDDGSGWYTIVTNMNKNRTCIRTEAGMYRRADIVHVCRIKWFRSMYSGIPKEVEHRLVRPYNNSEKKGAAMILAGEPVTHVTLRTKMLVLEKLAEETARHGVTEEYIVGRLKHWSDGDGKHALDSLKTLARAAGVELNQETKKGPEKVIGIFQQINNNAGTIQDSRRRDVIPHMKEIREIVGPVDQSTGPDVERVILPVAGRTRPTQ